jgi:hypothetical protein
MSVQSITTSTAADPSEIGVGFVQPKAAAMKVVLIGINAFCRTPTARDLVMGRVRELADSIREVGLQQPPVVRRVKTTRFGKEADAYEIMIGGHRIAACRQLEMLEVPCVVLEVGDPNVAAFR